MQTVKIKKSELINEIQKSVKKFGSTSHAIYVDLEGNVDTRHATEAHEGWVELIDLYSIDDYSDSEGNYHIDEEFDIEGVSEWIVNETDFITTALEKHNEYAEKKIEVKLI